MPRQYIYVFVLTSLSVAQQIAQACHACQESGAAYGCPSECHMVLVGVKSQENLQKISSLLEFNNIEHKMFYEPDVESYTAICTRPVIESERKIFKKFQVYK